MHETVQFCPYILMDIGRAARFWLFPCCPSEKRGRYFLKKTQNYQLNQWDASDRILREDFNADNAKIDAAMEANSLYAELAHVVTQNAATQIDLDVHSIDFTSYRKIEFFIHCPDQNYELCVKLNNLSNFTVLRPNQSGTSTEYYFYTVQGAVNTSPYATVLMNEPGRGRQISCIAFSSKGTYGDVSQRIAPINWEEFASLNLIRYGGAAMPAGIEISICGVKR
jgi:hypothetical protein